MTDEVMPQMAIQLIVVVVKRISVKCAFLSAFKIVYLLTLFFFAPSILFFMQQCCRPVCWDPFILCVMCACQVKRREKCISFYTLVAYIKHFNFTLLIQSTSFIGNWSVDKIDTVCPERIFFFCVKRKFINWIQFGNQWMPPCCMTLRCY